MYMYVSIGRVDLASLDYVEMPSLFEPPDDIITFLVFVLSVCIS